MKYSDSWKKLCELLKTTKSIKTLELYNFHDVGKDAVEEFCNALAINTSLEVLEMENLHSHDFSHIISALIKNTSLVDIKLSIFHSFYLLFILFIQKAQISLFSGGLSIESVQLPQFATAIEMQTNMKSLKLGLAFPGLTNFNNSFSKS